MRLLADLAREMDVQFCWRLSRGWAWRRRLHSGVVPLPVLDPPPALVCAACLVVLAFPMHVLSDRLLGRDIVADALGHCSARVHLLTDETILIP